ncbi:MAG TPA: HPF/RaiA family ribosome-associated protein [Steroidobacteraceae bacterium]|nr:HPF/RaiA family ribosome-associated protein [Steroidobacteraceae bacterium]
MSITFRRFERSGALEARIREVGERLQRCDPRISQCHISVLGDDGDEHSVSVRIHVSVPGAQIHADSANGGPGHTDAFLALQKAYEGARSQLRSLQRDGGKGGGLLSGVRS